MIADLARWRRPVAKERRGLPEKSSLKITLPADEPVQWRASAKGVAAHVQKEG